MDLSVGCLHPVQVAGMCAICGIAVDEDSNHSQETSSQLHDISGIQVNSAEAARLDSESTSRLLSHRKLALIVDLDQTIIHATVDPTVGEWMKDTSNPNYKALENVGKFRLGTDGKAILDDEDSGGNNGSESDRPMMPGGQQEGCWYYVKPRPGLQLFLAELAEKYEMYVYTMGTRSYAECVCRLVDPQGNLFGARILSRDENGSLLQKSLKKLFPMDTSMVVIIDDRADVWKWSPNLLKVVPFDFFVGIGDINASFLPAAPTVPTPTTDGKAAEGNGSDVGEETREPDVGKDAEDSTSGNEEQGEKARKEEAEATANAEKSQKSAVSEQLGSRPLAKMQEALDVKNDQQSTEQQTRSIAAVLRDDDRELQRLQGILDEVHSLWYKQWDARPTPDNKPAITGIIASLKSAVLSNSTIVFSSVIPLQQYPESSDLWRLASEFGAVCKTDMDDSVTHVVAAKRDTHKVFMGQKKNIPVVWPAWLHDSCARWARQPEVWYALPKPTIPHPQESDAGIPSYESDQLLFSSNDSDLPIGEGEEDDKGFGEMNWDEANDEVDAVLNGLSDEEDDTTDGGYTTDGSTTKRKKRTLSERSFNGDDDEEDDNNIDGKQDRGRDGNDNLSDLSKRRKVAESRVGQSKLKHVVPLEDDKSVKQKDSGYPGSNGGEEEGGDTDDDFLQSLQDELELQLGGSGDDQEAKEDEGLASDDE